MKKLFLQALLLICSFFLLWWAFSQVDWVEIFQPGKATDVAEEKLGELAKELLVREKELLSDPFANKVMDSLLHRICVHNSIADTSTELLLIRDDQVNAFAMPGRRLVLTSGIIQEAKNEQELCGVIAHELAHMEQNHVMKKLGKEIGYSVLMTVTSGGGAEAVREILHLLSSTAYDRELEEDADKLAVDYLANAGIDPIPFSDLMYRIAQQEGGGAYMDWIATHPNPEERAAYILECAKAKKTEKAPVLSPVTWINLQSSMQESM